MIRLITVAADVEREAALVFELQRDPRFEVVFRCFDRVETLAAVRATPAEVLLSVGASAWFDYQCFEEARRAGLVLLGAVEGGVGRELLEVWGFSFAARLDDIERLATGRRKDATEEEAAQGDGRLLVVWGPKGAPGRTTIAVEVAHVLAEADPSTLLADADLYGGDVAQILALAPGAASIVTVARSGARGELRDPASLASLPRTDKRGPHLLPGLLRAQLNSEVSVFGWKEVVRSARGAFTSTVVDVGFCLEPALDEHIPGRNEVALSCVEQADRIVCVVRADPVGLRNFLWAVRSHRDQVDLERAIVVANRVRAGEDREVRRLLSRHLPGVPLVHVPDRPDLVTEAMWRGVPVVFGRPDSPFSEAVRRVAEVAGADVPARGFLSRLAGKGGR
jgi:MinD-like ATPase involved in chromosome partitioning or flagellar assembly